MVVHGWALVVVRIRQNAKLDHSRDEKAESLAVHRMPRLIVPMPRAPCSEIRSEFVLLLGPFQS